MLVSAVGQILKRLPKNATYNEFTWKMMRVYFDTTSLPTKDLEGVPVESLFFYQTQFPESHFGNKHKVDLT